MNRAVLVLADDLFWRTKIDQAVKSAQRSAVFLSNPAELASAADPAKVAVILVDLSVKNEPFTAIAALKKSPKTKEIPIVGYFEHVRKDLLQKATEAGADEVLPRSTFSQKLADIVLKYAIPGSVKTEEEETELPEE